MNGFKSDPPPEEHDVVARLVGAAGPRHQAPDAVTRRVRAAVHAQWTREVRARRLRRRTVLVALPAIAGVVLAVLVALRSRPDTPTTSNRPPSPAVVVARLDTSTGSGLGVLDRRTGRWETLAAGGSVHAGASVRTSPGSRAALQMAAGASLRLGNATLLWLLSESDVFLEQGTVYIDNPPSRGAASALAVSTRVGTVRELGTQFEVRVEQTALRVRVREGTVVLEQDRRRAAASAGTELRVTSDLAVERRSIPVSGLEWAWVVDVAHPIAIEGRPLGEFLTWVTREMGWRLRFADEAVARRSAGIVLHGTIAGLTPDEALVSILKTCALTHRIEDDTLVILEPVGELR